MNNTKKICSVCRFESTAEELFSTAGFLRKTYCLSCKPSDRFRVEQRMVYQALCYFGLGLLILITPNTKHIGWLVINLGLLIFLWGPCTILHEAGHVITGRLAGCRVFGAVMGTGKVIFTIEFSGMKFDFGRYLHGGGLTYLVHVNEKPSRWAEVFFTLGGCLANLTAAGAVLMFVPYHDLARFAVMPTYKFAIAPAFVAVNLLQCIISLYPHWTKIGGRNYQSDGAIIIETLRDKDFVRNRLIGRYILEGFWHAKNGKLDQAKACYQEGYRKFNDSFYLACLVHNNLVHSKDYAAARKFYQSLNMTADYLAKQDPMMVAWIWNDVAWTNLMLGGSELLNEADEFSAKALGRLLDEAAVKGTRGSVLIEQGEIEQGIELLLQSIASSDLRPNQALNACLIAVGKAQQGNSKLAQEYFRFARHLDPACELLKKSEERIQSHATEA